MQWPIQRDFFLVKQLEVHDERIVRDFKTLQHSRRSKCRPDKVSGNRSEQNRNENLLGRQGKAKMTS
jgi:hypothetical protein